MRRGAVFILVVVAVACSPGTPASNSDGAWIGTTTTEGNVTTVVNQSGSVWGGTAVLVEETSIGVEAGADEYMFGSVLAVWATDDRIFVLDSQVPAVRVYDLDGEHLFDVGRQGQGPGEFTNPGGVAVTESGEILVIEESLQIDVFDSNGAPEDTWNGGSAISIVSNEMLILGADGAVWVPTVDFEEGRFGFSRIGEDKQATEPLFPPNLGWESRCLTYLRNARESRYCAIPFQPFSVSTLALDGSWVVGINDTYTFEVHEPEGAILRVERAWDPVVVTAQEAALRKQQVTEFMRERADDGAWSWNGPEIPGHKPAYMRLMADRNGRIWTLREQASRHATDCADGEPECWIPQGYWLDAFGADGRFLGSVTMDNRPSARPFIDGTTIVAIVENEAGTIMVKRYRLVLPGESQATG